MAMYRLVTGHSKGNDQKKMMEVSESPVEMISHIFSKVTLTERSRLEVVSPRWQSIVKVVKDQKLLYLTNYEIKANFTYTLESNLHFNKWNRRPANVDDPCYQPRHPIIENYERIQVHNSGDITSVLSRCPKLTYLHLEFGNDFVFSQQQLANDLAELCPLLEHLEWCNDGPKSDFLTAFGEFKNLSCWHVVIDDDDSDHAINALTRQPNLHLKSIIFGKGVNQLFGRLDPVCLESVVISHGHSHNVDINRFTRLKQFHSRSATSENYLHVQSLTSLQALYICDINLITENMLETFLLRNPRLTKVMLWVPSDLKIITLIAQYLPNIEDLTIKPADPFYFDNQDWAELSTLTNLHRLELGKISANYQPDLDGIQLVLQSCRLIQLLKLSNRHDLHLDSELRLKNSRTLCEAVRRYADDFKPQFKYIFFRHPNRQYEFKECEYHYVRWQRDSRKRWRIFGDGCLAIVAFVVLYVVFSLW